MTVDELPPRTAQQRALAGYRQSLRWGRRVYAAVIVLAIVAAVVVVKIAYSHGEISHATLRTTKTQLVSPPLRPIAATVTQAWRTSDATALGQPVWSGTVVTYGPRTVRGRNALTGEVTWSYTRTDRTVCTAMQVSGVTIAVFRLRGNCDQVMALDSDTGQRKWFRTLDKDGHPVNGTPSFSVGEFTVLITTPEVVYAIDPSGGLDRWTYFREGCRIDGAVIGTSGALISQNCTNPDCGTDTYCGTGQRLMLRDATLGRSDDDKKNPDKFKWAVAANGAVLPVSADKVVAAVDPVVKTLQIHAVQTGRTLAEPQLTGSAPNVHTVASLAVDDASVLWLGDTAYAVSASAAQIVWSTPATGSAAFLPTSGQDDIPGALATCAFLVPTSSGVDSVDGKGTVTAHHPVESPLPGSSVRPLGAGFVVAGDSTVAYR